MAPDLPREGLEGRKHTEIKGITFLRKPGPCSQTWGWILAETHSQLPLAPWQTGEHRTGSVFEVYDKIKLTLLMFWGGEY